MRAIIENKSISIYSVFIKKHIVVRSTLLYRIEPGGTVTQTEGKNAKC